MQCDHFSHNDGKEIPDWHLNILADRRAALREGRTYCIDWETAKNEINESIKVKTKDV
jgi:putative addiction module component